MQKVELTDKFYIAITVVDFKHNYHHNNLS